MKRVIWGCVLGLLLTLGLVPTALADNAKATFAGGCFWCMEHPFDELPGVSATVSGYMGGNVIDPTYGQVSSGRTGHLEVMQVAYDPTLVDYDNLLEVFWKNVDPFDGAGQFCDRGSQYQSAIFYHSDEQRQQALASKQALEASLDNGQPAVTAVRPAQEFYPAEDYHQDYYQTHPVRYRVYRFGCGRDRRLAEIWGEPSEATAGLPTAQ